MKVTDSGLEKDPEVSLLDGISLTKTTTNWQMDQHAARQFLVLVAIKDLSNTCKITLWSKDFKDTDTHTTTHKLTKSGVCNTKKLNRIILLRSKSRNFA